MITRLGLLAVMTILAGCAGNPQGQTEGGKPAQPLEVCLGGACGPAAGRFSKEELVGGLLMMLKANENNKITLCDTDPKTGQCAREGLIFFVQGGPIPGAATVDTPYITQVGLDKASLQIKYQSSASVTWVGTPVFCQDQYTELTVVSVDEVTMVNPGFACTWTLFPMVWTMRFAIQRIDFDQSVLSGRYTTSGGGLLIAGGGDGTFRMQLPRVGTLAAQPGGGKAALTSVAKVSPELLATPAPRAEDIAQAPKAQGPVDEAERRLWEDATTADSAQAYRRYLDRHPEGRFAVAARAKLEVARQAEAQRDEIAHWDRIKGGSDPAEFDRFVASYPKGLFTDLATARARLLRESSADRNEQQAALAAWENVRGSGSAADLEAYLKRYPDSPFAAQARQRVARLASQSNDLEMSMWETIKASRDSEDFKRFLKAFPQGLFAAAAAARLDALAAGDELTAWEQARAGNNPDQLTAFADRHAASPFAPLARRLAEQLRAASQEGAESTAWEKVRASRDIAAIDQFLTAFPQGNFAAAARQHRLDVIRRQAAEARGGAHLVEQPAAFAFPKGPEHADDVAVIIGNADYARLGKNIPDVRPAHADAAGMKAYATTVLGIRDGNVIFLKDATGAQMTRVFGSDKDPRGQLFDWVKPGKSRVFVYYSGHGAPGANSGHGASGARGASPYLVPADADSARIELNGYPVRQLYDNLGKLPAASVTVVLEACFSGLSPAGSVLAKASPVYFEVTSPTAPPNLTVISAGAANQIASWEPDDSHGLFTKHFLEAMTGKGDANKDGRVSLDELDKHLKETLTYLARRHYGRDQNAQIMTGGTR